MTAPNMTPDEVLAVLDNEIRALPAMVALIRHGEHQCDETPAIDKLQKARAAVAAMIAERDGYKAGWRDLVAALGTGPLPIPDAQYHESVVLPKIRELIARNAELEADNKALREDAERWRHYSTTSDSSLTLRLHYSRADLRNSVIDAARAEAGHG